MFTNLQVYKRGTVFMSFKLVLRAHRGVYDHLNNFKSAPQVYDHLNFYERATEVYDHLNRFMSAPQVYDHLTSFMSAPRSL